MSGLAADPMFDAELKRGDRPFTSVHFRASRTVSGIGVPTKARCWRSWG